MIWVRRILVANAVTMLLLLVVGVAEGAQRVTLGDAARKPTHTYVVRAGAKRVVTKCAGGGRPSDVQAYTRDGGALGPQISSEHGHVFYWKGYHGYVMYVTYNRTVTNGTHRAILFAIWCEG